MRCASVLTALSCHASGNQLSAALAAAALVLYLPALWLPFLRIERLGLARDSSLLGGVETLLAEGHWFVGGVVVLCSVVLPVLKLTALLVLSLQHARLSHASRAAVYRLVEHLGRWGMLDVLLVAVMIAFVKLGGLVQFSAGPGLVVFAAFVLLSLAASAAFDPYALWDEGLPLTDPAFAVGPTQNAASPAAVPPALDAIPHALPLPPSDSHPAVRSRRWLWCIPAAALVAVVIVAVNVYRQRGRLIELTFRDGHGIAVADELRYHGITCGKIESVGLSDDLSLVQLQVRLMPAADGLARDGARFWIVRPQLDLTGVAGLETVVGAKYVTLLPGDADAPRATQFIGLDEPPIPDLEEAGGVEVVLQSPHGAGLRRGLGVYYRDLRIGGVIATGLAGDGSAIETRLYVRPAYRHLVREESRFWNAGGVQVRGGLTEFFVHTGTAETLLRGGVAMSLPPEPGEPVPPGHRFRLYDGPEREWLEWQPAVTAGMPAWPQSLPVLQPAVLRWTHDGVFLNRPRERRGWLLPTPGGWTGPRDLLTVPPDALDGQATLLCSDTERALSSDAPPSFDGDIVQLSAELPSADGFQTRTAAAPEDVYLVTDPGNGPLFIAAVRLQAADGRWRIDPGLPLSSDLHGAAVVAASDGALLGRMLCVDDERWIDIRPHSTLPR